MGALDGPWHRWPAAAVVVEKPFRFFIDTCMFGVVYAYLFVTLFNDRPVGWCFFLYAFSQGKQNRV